MKKRLLICSALALAGCSSSPGTSDVKKFLEPKFASCENIEIVDIKKTNGYEEDGYYRVEFTYGIELKDPSMLKQLLHTHEQEKESVRTWLEATEARKKHISFLQREIDRIYDEYEALGVGSRTIGYLKTSVRCCMAERYFKQFWHHGNPLPRSCHADCSS